MPQKLHLPWQADPSSHQEGLVYQTRDLVEQVLCRGVPYRALGARPKGAERGPGDHEGQALGHLQKSELRKALGSKILQTPG